MTGSVPVLSGHVEVAADGTPTAVRAELDPGRVDTGHARRDRDLRGKRFFGPAPSPVLVFDAGPATRVGDDGWSVAGVLTLGGRSAAVAVDVEVLDGSHVRASTVLDRRDLGIRAPRLLVGRRVDVTVDASLAPQVPD